MPMVSGAFEGRGADGDGDGVLLASLATTVPDLCVATIGGHGAAREVAHAANAYTAITFMRIYSTFPLRSYPLSLRQRIERGVQRRDRVKASDY